ncbi:MAG: hypothetical protein RMJ53_08825, partial [Chitinophagales bacterium]|nr:hypothetical protein [Chitinophagales bacterium]
MKQEDFWNNISFNFDNYLKIRPNKVEDMNYQMFCRVGAAVKELKMGEGCGGRERTSAGSVQAVSGRARAARSLSLSKRS